MFNIHYHPLVACTSLCIMHAGSSAEFHCHRTFRANRI